MPRPAATPEQRAEVRERLRRAAAEIHRDEGIEAVTVRNVTRLAGVSSGSLYNSFASIGELLRSLWADPVAATTPALDRLVDAHTDPIERIRALLGAFVDFVDTHPDVHRSAMLFVRPVIAPEPERVPPDSLAFHRHLRTAIVDGQTAGTIRSGDPDRLAQLVWSGVHGVLALPINAELYDLEPGTALAPDMIDAMVDALRA